MTQDGPWQQKRIHGKLGREMERERWTEGEKRGRGSGQGKSRDRWYVGGQERKTPDRERAERQKWAEGTTAPKASWFPFPSSPTSPTRV